MKKIITILLIVASFFIGSTVRAADVVLSWDAAVGATSYKIQMSTDQGATWAAERVVPSGTTFTWAGAPDTGLVLFRAVSINAAGSAIRTDAGVWFNGAWKLPAPAGGLGAR
jgi:hypothetical protein